MRHRAGPLGTNQTTASGSGTLTVAVPVDEPAATGVPPGRHRAPGAPFVPRQLGPRHDRVTRPDTDPVDHPETEPCSATAEPAHRARWKAGHLPRVLAVAMLAAACLGTTTLALRYAEVRSADNTIALAVGVAVIVGLWALLIASAPQVVTLSGSVVTVKNTRGVESFDLADGMQPVDLVAGPGSSRWALLLHRADGTTLVLRRRDVDATELDPIVRQYRRIAERSRADRQARFDR